MSALEMFRKARGLTQAELAHQLGLRSKGHISNIESGRERCSLRLALKIEGLGDDAPRAAELCPDAADLLQRQPAEARP